MARALALLVLLPAALPAHAAEPSVLAVFDVEYVGLDLKKPARETLNEYLFSKVASAGVYTLVPRNEVKKRLVAQKKDSFKACYDQSCQIEVGKELAAQKSLSTKILKVDKECLVTLAVYDLRTAATDGAADATGACSTGALLRSIETAVLQLARAGAAASGGTAPAAAIAPLGEVDPKWCPEKGTRRLGAPYPDGQSVYCIDAQNKMSGTMTTWHASGKVSMKAEYQAGELSGTQSIFHQNGALYQRGKNEKGKKVGVWISYYDDGAKMEEGEYQNGARSKKWVRYAPDGKKTDESEYQQDQQHGLYTSYQSDGAVRETGRYVAGKKDGVWSELRSNGVKERDTTYKDGKRNGEELEYDSEGRKIRMTTYKLDKRSGPYREWRVERGKSEPRLEVEGAYEDGERHGMFTRYSEDGQPEDQTPYERGKKHGMHVHYTGHGEERRKYEEGRYEQDQKTGVWKRFDKNGEVDLEETWAKDKRNGRYTSWGISIHTGKRFKTTEGEYLDGEQNGTWLTFDDRGGIEREEHWKAGKKVGK